MSMHVKVKSESSSQYSHRAFERSSQSRHSSITIVPKLCCLLTGFGLFFNNWRMHKSLFYIPTGNRYRHHTADHIRGVIPCIQNIVVCILSARHDERELIMWHYRHHISTSTTRNRLLHIFLQFPRLEEASTLRICGHNFLVDALRCACRTAISIQKMYSGSRMSVGLQ